MSGVSEIESSTESHGSGGNGMCGGPNDCGPGFKTPEEATKGPRETIMYVQCIQPDATKPDYLATIDIDPTSPDFCTVIHRLKMLHNDDELHHSGWNNCSSCFDQVAAKRNKLILPCLITDRIYIIDMLDKLEPKHYKTIEPKELHDLNLTYPHTSHCLINGDIMISTIGTVGGHGQGAFVLLDGRGNDHFKVKGEWTAQKTRFGYDFWYQPGLNVMVSSEWGNPKDFIRGFNKDDITKKHYGNAIHFWNWKEKTYLQTIELGAEGWMPMATRFLHDPKKGHGYVACALSGNIFHFYLDDEEKMWVAKNVISVKPLTVTGWVFDTMPAFITDIIVSMDDKFLYSSNWAQGDIRQFNIEDPHHPKEVGRVWIGNSLARGGPVSVTGSEQLQPDAVVVKGLRIIGGPQMLQLSLDGQRLYVTNSLIKTWDRQFYPELIQKGSVLLQVDVNTEVGGLKLNKDFLVNFGLEPEGPVLAHEMRYPGGDCTSDIFSP